jgi:23S rRNA (uracil1939-C5)-methyltransferase
MAGFKQPRAANRHFKPKQRTVPAGEHTLQVVALSHDGRGIAKPKGKTTFIAAALPGEQVRVAYTASRKQYDEARLISIDQKSADRVDPPCRFAGQCGGCQLQHLTYQQQLAHKQQQLQHLMSGLGEVDWLPALAAAPLAYRHRARFAIQAKGDTCLMGFRADNSHKVVDLPRCEIVSDLINTGWSQLRQLILSLKGRSQLTDCVITENTVDGRLAVLLIGRQRLSGTDLALLEDFAQQHACQLSLADQAATYQPWWQSGQQALFSYQLDNGLKLEYGVSDFTQVNQSVNEAMVQRAVEWLALEPGDRVADFFAGIGNFTLPLAKVAGSVHAVEVVEEMVAKLMANAAANQLGNVQAVAGNLFSRDLAIPDTLTKALLDPPRAGALELCSLLAESELQAIVYVSCNPSTLKRDLALLLAGGYQLSKACLVDMFPNTYHAEVMVLLLKN